MCAMFIVSIVMSEMSNLIGQLQIYILLMNLCGEFLKKFNVSSCGFIFFYF